MSTSTRVALHVAGCCLGYMAAGVFLILYLRDTSVAAWVNQGPAGWTPDLILAVVVWIVAWLAIVKGGATIANRNR